jgi:serine/threonine protein kinase
MAVLLRQTMTDVPPKSVHAQPDEEEPSPTPEETKPDRPPEPKVRSRTASTVPPAGAPLWNGRFRIGDELGRGAMGHVLRATDGTLKRDLAFKVSPAPKDQLSRAELARFIEEARITLARALNVVPVHDIGLDRMGAHSSMKLIRGISRKHLR